MTRRLLTGTARTEAFALYATGLSIQKTAEQVGVSFGTLQASLAEEGLTRPHGSTPIPWAKQAEVLRLRDAGLRYRDIAAQTGVSIGSITKIAQQAGRDARPRGPRSHRSHRSQRPHLERS